jgi:hypothetical protein
MTHTFQEVAAAPQGILKTEIAVDQARRYDIYASTVAGEPPVPSASTLTELEPVEPERKAPFWQRLGRVLARIVAAIRGDR